MADIKTVLETGSTIYSQFNNGIEGPQGAPFVNYIGAYNAETSYAQYDGVTYLGSSYMALKTSLNHLPTDTEYWVVISAKGDKGEGVASGGVVGQYLHKKSITDYDTEFKTIDSTEVAYGDGNVSEGLGNRYTKSEADTLLGNKVDKVTGSSLVPDTAITDLSDGGDTTLHTHKSIVNEVSVDNAKVEALATGVKITRNIADANIGLIVNQHASSTGDIAQFQVGGVRKASFDKDGSLLTYNINATSSIKTPFLYNTSGDTNAKYELLTTGSKISRNIADANPALIVNQANASSTGDLLRLQIGGLDRFTVTYYGSLTLNNHIYVRSGFGIIGTNSLHGSYKVGSQTLGNIIKRDMADAYQALVVDQANASSTGLITDFQFGGVSKASVDKDGIISSGAKSAHNGIGGFMIRMTNKTGATSVPGSVVMVSDTTDNAYRLNIVDSDMPIGVVYDAVADGAEGWVVVSGIASVLLVDTVATTRGYVVYSSASVAGRIDTSSSVPAALTHFREIGHTIESKAGGTNTLVKCVLHFN